MRLPLQTVRFSCVIRDSFYAFAFLFPSRPLYIIYRHGDGIGSDPCASPDFVNESVLDATIDNSPILWLESDATIQVADQSPRKDFPVEWWFLQGRFKTEQTGPRAFMASLFRYSLEWAGRSGGNACSLLVSLLDESSGTTKTLSQVDSATIPFLVSATQTAPLSGLDPLAMRAAIDEISEYGLSRWLRMTRETAKFEGPPFRATWDGFQLAQTNNEFVLRFTEPETNRLFRFQLKPIHPRFHLSIAAEGTSMDYVSYPRLALEGEMEGAAVSGEAWLDHQWGSQGWFVAGENKEQIIGWQWMGIQLDNDCELMVMITRDQRTGETLGHYGVLVDQSGSAHLLSEFAIVPTGWWNSPKSSAAYPVACRVQIPQLDLELDFQPACLDQEIALLPPIRGVWEGAGRVSGVWGRRRVSGHARLELHGYAYVIDFAQYFRRVTHRIRQNIETFLPRVLNHSDLERIAGPAHGQYDPEAQTTMLTKPIWDLIDRGGKQWRPIFGMLMVAALGADPTPFESLICVTSEMLHDGALMIDDIEDKGRIRRGQECIHLRYGLDVAISAGNTAYFLPMVLLRDHPDLSDAQRLELFRILSRLFIRAHLGQGQDLYWSKLLTRQYLSEWTNDSIVPKILQVYTQKTASVVEAAAEGACVIANADGEMRRHCADFGRTLGVAFQIVNDMVDFSDVRIDQGSGGSDIAEGKLTYAIVKALSLLPTWQRDHLADILCSPKLRQQPAMLADAIELVRCSGALALCQTEAHSMVQNEWRRLSCHLPPSEAKTSLRVLWNFLLSLASDPRYTDFAPGN